MCYSWTTAKSNRKLCETVWKICGFPFQSPPFLPSNRKNAIKKMFRAWIWFLTPWNGHSGRELTLIAAKIHSPKIKFTLGEGNSFAQFDEFPWSRQNRNTLNKSKSSKQRLFWANICYWWLFGYSTHFSDRLDREKKWLDNKTTAWNEQNRFRHMHKHERNSSWYTERELNPIVSSRTTIRIA